MTSEKETRLRLLLLFLLKSMERSLEEEQEDIVRLDLRLKCWFIGLFGVAQLGVEETSTECCWTRGKLDQSKDVSESLVIMMGGGVITREDCGPDTSQEEGDVESNTGAKSVSCNIVECNCVL